jgi:hypothetical protein
MQVYYLQRFWFYNVYNSGTTPQTHHYTMTFDPPVTVKGQIFLNILSQGVSFDQKVVGLAAAGVKSYTYVDNNGQEQTVDFAGQDPSGSIFVTNITSVTWFLTVTLAWAGAQGMIYYIE